MTADWSLDWQRVDDIKSSVRRFQAFCCTQPWPTTARGRRLPRHPRPWEWDAQRHIKNLDQLARPGDVVMVGVDDSAGQPVDAAVLHLRFLLDGTRFVATVEVAGVALTHRSPDPPFIGDEVMAVAQHEAEGFMAARSCTRGLLAGFIHVDNDASMRMAARNDWEPLEDPLDGGYVRWGLPLR